jgi:hypothetical protein
LLAYLAAKYLQTFEEGSALEIVPPEYCSGEIVLGRVECMGRPLRGNMRPL